MITKEIFFEYGDNNSEVLTLFHPSSFEKQASYSGELSDFISKLKERGDKIYALVNALSAGEFYGPNRNGDYFPEEALQKHHKTFEELGHVYEHHVNKDTKKALGKVIFAFYNTRMHRVELILELDKKKASHIVKRLAAGDLPATSMGCHVPYDVCSICGNRAKSRLQYCDDLRKHMNEVLPGGKKVYAKNLQPKFFDLSIVLIPAEKTSRFLKVLSGGLLTKEASIKKLAFNDKNNYIKLADLDITAEIRKQISGEIKTVSDDPKGLFLKRPRIDGTVLKKLGEYPLNEVLSTMLALRIMPGKRDFQKLALYSLGKTKLAEELDASNSIFTIDGETKIMIPSNVDLSFANEKIASLLDLESTRLTLTKEHVITRHLLKVAAESFPVERSLISKVFFSQEPEPEVTSVKNPIIPLGILGSLYYGYAKVFNNVSPTKFKSFMLKHPWLVPVLVGGGTVGSIWSQKAMFDKEASVAINRLFRNSLISFPLAYVYSGVAEDKAKNQVPISSADNFVRKHPALTGIIGTIGLTKAEKHLRKIFSKVANFVYQMPEKEIDTLYLELINI